MRHFLGKTKDGIKVFVDQELSHAATHLHNTPELTNLVREALSQVDANFSKRRVTVDLGRPIGLSDLVPTTKSDSVVYAIRPNRDTYTRFVYNREPVLTSLVTMELRPIDSASAELFTVYLGPETPPTPGSPNETPESKLFWLAHALVWGRQPIIPGTETAECPW